MRLWHSKLIPLLDGRRLCDLHMSCCNLRGNGWGKRNAAVGYLYEDPLGEDALVAYHYQVLLEMDRRGYNFSIYWLDPCYCGKNRPARVMSHKNLEEAHLREEPLLGHTFQIFIKDLKVLQERGLPISLQRIVSLDLDSEGNEFETYVARNGDRTIRYEVRL